LSPPPEQPTNAASNGKQDFFDTPTIRGRALDPLVGDFFDTPTIRGRALDPLVGDFLDTPTIRGRALDPLVGDFSAATLREQAAVAYSPENDQADRVWA